jgi:gliding motility-associated lipoprotein GldB
MLLKISTRFSLKQGVLMYMILLITSCTPNTRQADVSGIRAEVKAERFERDLFSSGEAHITDLEKKYGSFFNLFIYKLTELGTPDTSLLRERIRDFCTDADLREIFNSSEKINRDFTGVDAELTDAFRHYKYYFPNKVIPRVITFISGFNYAVVAADSAIGIGLDMYLGSDSKYYPALQFPHYKIVRMRKEYITADCIRGWAQSEWEPDQGENDFLSQAIYSGKILYFLDLMMPDVSDTIKTGYSNNQLKWCDANEKNTWSFFIDQKLLFSTDQNQIVKFLNDGPTTNGFPKESPGAIGQWLGWKIVQAYMKNNSAVTLDQLMGNHDYKKILHDSKYKPGK